MDFVDWMAFKNARTLHVLFFSRVHQTKKMGLPKGYRLHGLAFILCNMIETPSQRISSVTR